MLAYNIADILRIIPEAKEMVKSASIEQDFPMNNKSSVCAAYLNAQYLTKIASKKVPLHTLELLDKAASLYGVKAELDNLSKAFNPSMEKSASAVVGDLKAEFDFCFGSGVKNLEKTAALANRLHEMGVEDSNVDRYSGNMYLNKKAAVLSLANRYHATKEEAFVKVARLILDDVRENDFAAIRSACDTVTSLDKQAGLDIIGFDFYRDALFTKQAASTALTINLAGEDFPIEKLVKYGKQNITNLLGDAVGKDYSDDLVNNKYMLEALPRDQQIMLKTALKGI